MSSQAGWYPDPGRQPGLFRFWDGNNWSPHTTTDPARTPLPGAGAGGFGPPGAQGSGVQGSSGASGVGSSGGYPMQPGAAGASSPAPKKTAWGWWIGALVVLLVVVLAMALFIRGLTRTLDDNDDTPADQPTTQTCPTSSPSAAPEPKPQDGRVHGGALSFPELGAPWTAPEGDDRVPFGRDVTKQQVMVHEGYSGLQSWVASVLVGDLVAGDGFFTPEQGAEIVVRCVIGTFYGEGTVVGRADSQNEATTIDGRDAWIVTSQLSFDIPNLPTKGELLIVVIVATGPASSSLYYASIPDDSPPGVMDSAEALVGQLKVRQ